MVPRVLRGWSPEGPSNVAARVGGGLEQLRISLPAEGAGALQTAKRKLLP